MQDTELVSAALQLKGADVESVEVTCDGFVARLRLTSEHPVCSGCGQTRTARYDRRPARFWRALDFCGNPLFVEYAPRRVLCLCCGISLELVPWAEHRSRFTRAFEEHAAYLAQKCDKSMVARLMRVAWNTLGALLERVIERHQAKPRMEGLRRIGIDELSYRKHHRYLTIVTDLDTHRVVWAAENKSIEVVGRFFADLGSERAKQLELISLDLSPSYLQAIRTLAPHAQVVLDRFHAQELVHFAVDEVRRDEVNLLRKHDGVAARELKNTRWVLLKGKERLSPGELEKLAVVQARHKRLAHAWALKERFREVLSLNNAETARKGLKDWCNRGGSLYKSLCSPEGVRDDHPGARPCPSFEPTCSTRCSRT
jgi:transposase